MSTLICKYVYYRKHNRVANGVVVFNERIVRRSGVLQLLLLDGLYARPGQLGHP